ncbi:hypothetical protein C3489_28015 [Streptomyces sp. Ru71]|uniref:hypothetical protein n=1 Tax=Streptomyces sp. Ru71 TaxID=2080746 RepID=UPI000CDD40BE|nr:hypothetical protein [Streptomyces sp. Ru71]POX48085.1 hypothetical protein C3489_28015 [Streptomyces sp. Ru71]
MPADRLDPVGAAPAALPQTRLSAATTGSANLLLQAWLHTPEESRTLEEQIVRRFPEVSVSGRELTLHAARRLGHLLDGEGRRRGHVPITVWPSGGALAR